MAVISVEFLRICALAIFLALASAAPSQAWTPIKTFYLFPRLASARNVGFLEPFHASPGQIVLISRDLPASVHPTTWHYNDRETSVYTPLSSSRYLLTLQLSPQRSPDLLHSTYYLVTANKKPSGGFNAQGPYFDSEDGALEFHNPPAGYEGLVMCNVTRLTGGVGGKEARGSGWRQLLWVGPGTNRFQGRCEAADSVEFVDLLQGIDRRKDL